MGYNPKARSTGNHVVELTLVFVVQKQKQKVLLAKKKRKVGVGKWNGYGGVIQINEQPLEAAIRELKEETRDKNGKGGITPTSIKKKAILHCYNHREESDGGGISQCRIYVYVVDEWSGEAHENSEMGKPQWFHFGHLPYSEMLPGDREWILHVLSGKIIGRKKLIAHITYVPGQIKLFCPVKIDIV